MRGSDNAGDDDFSPENVAAIAGACQTPQERAIAALLIDGGMRRRELLLIDAADIDWGDGAILIRHGKGAKMRTIVPGFRAMRELRAYVGPRTSGRVFPFGKSTLARRLDAIEARCLAAGYDVGRIFPRRFRASFICTMLEDDVDLIAVGVMVGHEDVATTRRYQKKVEQRRARKQQRRHSILDQLAG